MDRNEVRAVLRAYTDIRKAIASRGIPNGMLDMEDMVDNVIRAIDQYPETYLKGPDLRRP